MVMIDIMFFTAARRDEKSVRENSDILRYHKDTNLQDKQSQIYKEKD